MQHVRLPCPQVFMSALFIVAKNKKGKQPNFKCISISTEWNITESKTKKDWTTHTQNSKDKSQKYTQSGRKCESVSCSVVSDSLPPSVLSPARLLCPWDCLDKNTRVDCHSLPQEIFLTQGSNPDLSPCRQILGHLSYQGSPWKADTQKTIHHNDAFYTKF